MRIQDKKQHLIILYLFHNYIQSRGTKLKWSGINKKYETAVIKCIGYCLHFGHVIWQNSALGFQVIPRFGFQTVFQITLIN